MSGQSRPKLECWKYNFRQCYHTVICDAPVRDSRPPKQYLLYPLYTGVIKLIIPDLFSYSINQQSLMSRTKNGIQVAYH